MNKSSKIYIAAHTGLAGSAIFKYLKAQGYMNLLVNEHDLADQSQTKKFFSTEKPEYVFLPSLRSGSIRANVSYPAEFLYENLGAQTNIIHAAHATGVKKLLYLAASCIYPTNAPQPIKEESFLTGPLEETSLAYATAKIAGVVMCQAYNQQYQTNFICAVPPTLYGADDDFDLENSHVLTALIKKFHEAKVKNDVKITLWGTGKPVREFMFAEDFAQACLFLMDNYDDSRLINIASGEEVGICALADLIKNVAGYSGKIRWNRVKPDGASKKALDGTKLNALGWKAKTTLRDGIKTVYGAFMNKYSAA